MKKITIDDIAKRARVSKGTVSAVINARTTVKQATRDHILEVMKESNYHPKGVAKNLKYANQEKSIGLIIKDLTYPFYASISKGVSEYAEKKGYSVIVASSNDNHECENKLTRLFSSKDIKGVIIAPVVEGMAEIEHLLDRKSVV
jgi:LacI family transcriptional regulator